MELDTLFDVAIKNLKYIIFPEEWLVIDNQISKQDMLALIIIDRYENVIMSQISDNMGIPMSTATGIIDRLVKKDFAKRTKDANDRRIVKISLTNNGVNLVQSFKSTLFSYFNEISEVLTTEEIEMIYKIFMKIINIFKSKNLNNDKNEKENILKKIEID